MDGKRFLARFGAYIRRHHLGLIAIFIALTGTAVAASTKTAPKNSVVAKSIKKGAVKKAKLAPDSVDGSKVTDRSLTGADIDVSTLGQVPSAATAATAGTATIAETAKEASHAASAGNAIDATRLGGAPAVAYAKNAEVLKGDDPIPGGPLGGTYAAPTLRGTGSASAGILGIFAPDACDASSVGGSPVTITAPTSGLVEVMARVHFQVASGNTFTACLVIDNSTVVQVMESTSLTGITLYTFPNNDNGIANSVLADWIPFFLSAGQHTIELNFGRVGVQSGTNQVKDRLLLVRALT